MGRTHTTSADAATGSGSLKRSFPPVARPDAIVLILGSLPGEESLRRQQYYAHKSNRFWWIMGELIGASPGLPYEVRLERLRESRIALWDVCAAAIRPGSLDANILPISVEANDFPAFLDSHSDLQLICFNGSAAAAMFRRKVRVGSNLRTQQLPSTSPAHAAMPAEQKLAAWRAVLGNFIGPAKPL
jgi:double-stranded uracil-DNA glycosylase